MKKRLLIFLVDDEHICKQQNVLSDGIVMQSCDLPPAQRQSCKQTALWRNAGLCDLPPRVLLQCTGFSPPPWCASPMLRLILPLRPLRVEKNIFHQSSLTYMHIQYANVIRRPHMLFPFTGLPVGAARTCKTRRCHCDAAFYILLRNALWEHFDLCFVCTD